MNKIRLSIIIATKGREEYCTKTIASILPLIGLDTEIVVSDNSDSYVVEDYIKNLNNLNIVYKHTKGVISVSDNYNIAFEMASGDYLCMIGDDDGILPTIYKALDFAYEHNVDVISQNNVLNYVWPTGDINNGVIYIVLVL